MKVNVTFAETDQRFVPQFGEIQTIGGGGDRYSEGFEAGKQAEYDAFWENYLSHSKKTGTGFSLFAGPGWNENTKFPYTIDFITDGYNMFVYCGAIPKTETAKIDFSKFTRFPNWNYSSIKELPELDTRGASNIGLLFAYCSSLKSVDNIILKEDGTQTGFGMFSFCSNLEELRFTGVIGASGLDLSHSTKLSKASITSIINALSTTTSGLSTTLSRTAVTNAFGSTTAAEWTTLAGTRSNWTISLV